MAARYEADGKYWELEPKGKTAFTARWGKIGGSGRNERAYTFADAAAATKARDKLVAEKTKAGFALVGKGANAKAAATPKRLASGATNPKLEAMLADNPDDAGTWSVYADWLLENGEPWGEVIAAAANGKRPKKQQDEAAAEILRSLDGSSIKWKYGSIDVLELSPNEDPAESDDRGDTMDDFPMPRALRRALAHPAGRLVRKLVLGLPPPIVGDIRWDFDSVIPSIVKAGPLPLLHTIDMSHSAEHMDQDSWRCIGDLRKLWQAVPRLRELRMLGAQGSASRKKSAKPVMLGDIDAPHLETFVFISGGLDNSVSVDLGKAKLPSLRRLELYFGSDNYGNTHTLASLAGILGGKGMPKLEYLGLKNSEWERDLIDAVAKSAIVKRVKVLDLSMGTLFEEGAEALLANANKLCHLDKLDLDDNFLPDDQCKKIRKAIPCAYLGAQREPDEYNGTLYRFASIGE